MARQRGAHHFEGKLGDLVGYQRNGKYFLRKKSNLTAERVKTDPKFQNSMAAANRFGQDAALAGLIRSIMRPWETGLVHGNINADITRKIQACKPIDPPPPATHLTARDLSRWQTLRYRPKIYTALLYPNLSRPHMENNILTLHLGCPQVPKYLIKGDPPTHMSITLILSRIPKDKKVAKADPITVHLNSPWLPMDQPCRFEVNLAHTFTHAAGSQSQAQVPGETPWLLIALHVQAAQELNQMMYPLQSLTCLDVLGVRG